MPLAHHDRRPTAPAELRALAEQDLTQLLELTRLLEDLIDTHQRGLGFLTPAARLAIDDLIRTDRAARYPTMGHLQVGQKFLRPLTVIAASGASPVPGNLAAISLSQEIPLTLLDLRHRLLRRLELAGVCLISRPADRPTTRDLVDELRTILRHIQAKSLLLDVTRTLADLTQRTRDLVHGNDKTAHHRPCPHCGRMTLVVYLTDGVIRCERDPHTGQYETCVCDDSYCDCKVRHHRHEWRRATPSSKKWSWHTLARDQNRVEHEQHTDTSPKEPPA